MNPCTNRNARPNNNQLITYYKRVSYLQKIHTIHSRIYLQYSHYTMFSSLSHSLQTKQNGKNQTLKVNKHISVLKVFIEPLETYLLQGKQFEFLLAQHPFFVDNSFKPENELHVNKIMGMHREINLLYRCNYLKSVHLDQVFFFTCVNIEEKTSSTVTCLIRLRLMPL